jgi:putative membrane protein
MNWKTLAFATCLIAGVVLVSCDDDDDDNNSELNDADRNFMIRTSISNTAEVGTATLALNKATTPQVLAFAQHMIAEHSLAQAELKNLGTTVGQPVKDTLDPAHVTLLAQLSALSGRAFDSAYIHTQVIDHEATLTNFENEQDNGRHRDVKAYADRYRPHIEQHLVRADSIAIALFPQ